MSTSRGTRRITPKVVSPQPEPLAWCTGLAIQVGVADTPRPLARKLAAAVAARVLGEGWRVEPLGAASRDFVLRRSDKGRVPLSNAWRLARELDADRDVVRAEPVLVAPGLEPPPEQREQLVAPAGRRGVGPRSGLGGTPRAGSANHRWSLQLCSVPAAWSAPLPRPNEGRSLGEGVVIGHPDTGYTRHPRLWAEAPQERRLLAERGYDFVDDDRDATDPMESSLGGLPGHGTSTASVIMGDSAGVTAQVGASGVAPRAQLVPLRVSRTVVHLSFENVARAVHTAVEHGCHVISMSLGGPLKADYLHRAICDAIEQGLIVLGAAGNYWPWVIYPARYEEVIAVGAVHCDRGPWSGSAQGPAIDLCAPGESVWVARARPSLPDVVEQGSGTSFAVATTAGACALWLAHHGRGRLIAKYGARNLAAVFKDVLLRDGVDTPAGWPTERLGAGILNADRLLRAPLPATVPATGMRAFRATTAARRVSDLDEVLAYLPGAQPSVVQQRLAAALGTTERELPAALTTFGDELLFHLATNPQVRAALGGAEVPVSASSRRATPKGDAPRSSVRGLAVDPQFRKAASRELRALVEGVGRKAKRS